MLIQSTLVSRHPRELEKVVVGRAVRLRELLPEYRVWLRGKKGIENGVRKAVQLPEFPLAESWLYIQRFAFCMY